MFEDASNWIYRCVFHFLFSHLLSYFRRVPPLMLFPHVTSVVPVSFPTDRPTQTSRQSYCEGFSSASERNAGARAPSAGSQALAEGGIPFLRQLRAPARLGRARVRSSRRSCAPWLSLTGTVFQRARVHQWTDQRRPTFSFALSEFLVRFVLRAMNHAWFWQARKVCRVLSFFSRPSISAMFPLTRQSLQIRIAASTWTHVFAFSSSGTT
jgi:hypothetical protein